jgi:hypothetical protein
MGQSVDALLQFFFAAGGPSRADFLDYLTKGAIIWSFQIGFVAGTETTTNMPSIYSYRLNRGHPS